MIVENWTFLLCMVVELSISRSSINEDVWSWKIILNALSRSLSIRLFNFLIWNILTNGQQPNSEAIKAFIVILRLRMLMNCEILDKTYNFLLTRLQIFVTWVSKSSLLFKFIPNSLLSLLFLITSLSILKGILSLLFLITSLSISHDQREDRHSFLKRTSSPTFSKSANSTSIWRANSN